MSTTRTLISRAALGLAAGLLGLAAATATLPGSASGRREPAPTPATGTTSTTAGGSGTTGTGAAATAPPTAPAVTSTTATSTPGTVPVVEPVPSADGSSGPDLRTIVADGAGTVTVAGEGDQLRVTAAAPEAGWRAEVEQAAGREVEVQFHTGGDRVDVDVELEGGVVRERVRHRADDGRRVDHDDDRDEDRSGRRGDGHGGDGGGW